MITDEDGKEWYVITVPKWVMDEHREALNPWPEIMRMARRQLARIGF